MRASQIAYSVIVLAITIVYLALVGAPLLTAKEVTCPENPSKKKFENFSVSIVTGQDNNGSIIPPYLIITEQRFLGEAELHHAFLSNKTSELLMASLLVSQTSSIEIGGHKVTIIRSMYQFKPPAEQYILRMKDFDNLKNSFPFLGLIIDTDGKEIHGNIGTLPES